MEARSKEARVKQKVFVTIMRLLWRTENELQSNIAASMQPAGHFMLANTRFSSQSGYVGRLYGPSLPGNMQYCLRFFYTLYGFSKVSDSLAVYIFEENQVVQEKIWSVRESPKSVWLQAEININKPMTCKV
ncbi:unnamed protein product [Ranitomeya imitator]|uniref:MAM domain-containing protein n=1 Tax=Ranitomeya imitator TaxID=111125 RepID=A0ABN9M2S2_9NEOB|nr:unnamed protein product [Ranitomeya imitator]